MMAKACLPVPLLEDLPPVKGARVLLRADFNVPIDHSVEGPAVVADDFRIRAALPTIEWLLGHGASVTACTHLGRPGGKFDPSLVVDPVRRRLAELAPEVDLLENVRFDPGEKTCDPDFVEKLIDGFDVFVNDAFGVSHRTEASVVGPPRYLPSAAGRLVAREVEVIGGLLDKPATPFVAVVGGSKVGDKIGVVTSLLDHVDQVIVGGGMAFTFLAAQGMEVGESLLDPDRIDQCRDLLASAGGRIILPVDSIALGPGGQIGQPSADDVVGVFDGSLPAGFMGVDIGPRSAEVFASALRTAGTILWNGPMGVFEDSRFASGTRAVAEAVVASTGFSVVGGGDSAAALDRFGLSGGVDYVSTGGGASLELIEFGDLPGLAALREASNFVGRVRS